MSQNDSFAKTACRSLTEINQHESSCFTSSSFFLKRPETHQLKTGWMIAKRFYRLSWTCKNWRFMRKAFWRTLSTKTHVRDTLWPKLKTICQGWDKILWCHEETDLSQFWIRFANTLSCAQTFKAFLNVQRKNGKRMPLVW